MTHQPQRPGSDLRLDTENAESSPIQNLVDVVSQFVEGYPAVTVLRPVKLPSRAAQDAQRGLLFFLLMVDKGRADED